MKLGYIDFINCYPFYYHMFEKKPVEDVTIVPGYPGALNNLLSNSELDMSPISSATCADIHEDLVLLPQFCLSSVGYVGSVTLVSNIPIEELDKKKIGVTNASHTSAVLLKILLKKYYNARPLYQTTGPRPQLEDFDAALLIGNDAMIKNAVPPTYSYDLGDLWLRKTGHPVVFAVFAIKKSSLDKHRSTIDLIISSYQQSLKCLKNEKTKVIKNAKQKYPDIIYDINNYYDLLKFEFTDELKKALMFYFLEGANLNLIQRTENVTFYTGQTLSC
jgi:chorismate dehydratase